MFLNPGLKLKLLFYYFYFCLNLYITYDILKKKKYYRFWILYTAIDMQNVKISISNRLFDYLMVHVYVKSCNCNDDRRNICRL